MTQTIVSFFSSHQTTLETVHWMNVVQYGTFPDLNPHISS